MRFWLWLTTSMVTEEWVAIHRQHHKASDTHGDPHSPAVYGIWRVFFGGAFLYAKAKKDRVLIARMSTGCPDDWIENNLYKKHTSLGIILMLLINLCLFGLWGWLVWGIQMIWIPLWAAGVINGLAHWWGYRNYDSKDTSRNLLPWGILIGGEELHNNHHGGQNAKLSSKWYEFDIGWMYITILKKLGLATVR
jgi:stearoyl-CoA desaturase (delta-9 desaturase)